jgi:hypothetical protein
MREPVIKTATLSPEAFAVLGGSRFGYIKAVPSEEVAFRYPGAPQLAAGGEVFALHAADGTPVMLADTRESAMMGAQTHQLEIVSLH